MEKELKYVIFKTEWGFFGLLANWQGVIKTVLPQRSYNLAKKYLLVGISGAAKEDKVLFPGLQKSIISYYKGSYIDLAKGFPGAICLPASVFARKVLKACMKIPVGKTIAYAKLAEKAGFPNADRAVGTVLAKNQLPLIIPCHRVIRSDGKVGNFSAAGGAKMKLKMLSYEKQISSKYEIQNSKVKSFGGL